MALENHNVVTQTLPQAPSRHPGSELPLRTLHSHPVVLFPIFLPIPPLLSLLYMTTGHAILRQSHPTFSIYHAPILSSVQAGATGGAILSLPIAFLLYLLIFPNRQPPVPEDFFEDDDSVTTSPARWMMYAGYLISVFFLVGIGGIAGPLGVTCLSSDTSVIMKKYLSTGAATAAGFVGGVVLSLGILFLGLLLTISVWLFWMKRNKPSP